MVVGRVDQGFMRIAARYCGPPDSANGGYCAGLLAKQLTGSVEVTLRKPPPLDRELQLQLEPGRATLMADGDLIAEAREAPLELELPRAPSFHQAELASEHYVGHRAHLFPTCFVCGPARAVGDGLRIFPGSAEPNGMLSAPWVPDASLVDDSGQVKHEIVWAALDCTGYFAGGAPDFPLALLGRMTAELLQPVVVEERCVVLGWSLGREGRKLYAGTAIFGADGTLKACARQTWISLQGEAASRRSDSIRSLRAVYARGSEPPSRSSRPPAAHMPKPTPAPPDDQARDDSAHDLNGPPTLRSGDRGHEPD